MGLCLSQGLIAVDITGRTTSFTMPTSITLKGSAGESSWALSDAPGAETLRPLGPKALWADVRLEPGVATVLTATSNTGSATFSTTWTPLALDQQRGLRVFARSNDEVALATTLPRILVRRPDGTQTQLAGGAAVRVPLNQTGSWRFESQTQAGARVGYAELFVVGISAQGRLLPDQIVPIDLNSKLTYKLPSEPATLPAGAVWCGSYDPALRADSKGGPTFTATAMGDHLAVGRVAGPNGPVLAAHTLRTVDIITTGTVRPLASRMGPNGQRLLECEMLVIPAMPDMRLKINTFAHKSIFAGGITSMDIPLSISDVILPYQVTQRDYNGQSAWVISYNIQKTGK
jgi:hypothetical protein